MTVGSSGQCVEICGKSLNFGLLECDNGAAAGCTDCTIATGYACTGGSPTTPDVCTTDYPEYDSITATDTNNLFVYFDREMVAAAALTTSSFTISIVDKSNTAVTDFTWTVPTAYYTAYQAAESARYIYIELDINKELEAGATVTVLYGGGGSLVDTNGAELRTSATISGTLNANFKDASSIEKSIALSIGLISTLAISIAILVPIVLGFKNGSREGMVMSVFGIQAIYYTGLIDVTHSAIFSGFIQHLKVFTLESDMIPNFLTMMMKQSDRTSTLLTYDDLGYYKLANTIEFDSLKLLILFIFGVIWAVVELLPLCIKNKLKKKKLARINDFLVYKFFICMFIIMFCPFGYSAFAEVENIERTSPYKIVSVSATFLFIMTIFLFLVAISKVIQYTPIKTDELPKGRFNMFQAGIKNKKRSLYFYPWVMSKMILVMILTVILSTNNVTLGILLLVVNSLSSALIGYMMPFEKTAMDCKGSCNLTYSLVLVLEILLTAYFSILVQFNDEKPNQMMIFGYLQICLVLIFCIVAAILGVMSSYKIMIEQNSQAAKKTYIAVNLPFYLIILF